eukprot:m51a1_g8400 hypothetical protein (528) ;mRNA; f:230025-231700
MDHAPAAQPRLAQHVACDVCARTMLSAALLASLLAATVWCGSANAWCTYSADFYHARGIRGVPVGPWAVSLSFFQAALCAALLFVHQRLQGLMPPAARWSCAALGALSLAGSGALALGLNETHRTAFRFLVHFAPAVHLLCVALLSVCAVPVARLVVLRSDGSKQPGGSASGPLAARAVGVWLAVLLLVVAPPLLIESGSTGVLRGPAPLKPRLVAHRGVSRVAPENSLEGVQAASGTGMFGVEFDVVVARDGVPVLLHDRTLARTTDVGAVFPGREADDPSSFTSEELSRLTLSRWCSRGCDGPESAAAELVFGRARVPTMAQVLAEAQRQRLHALWDLREPSNEHAGHWMDIVLNTTLRSAVADPSLVWWLADRMAERARAAGFKRACPVSHGHWEAAEGRQCDVLNMHHGVSGRELRRARASGAWVNVYVVDAEWLFAQMWVLGVDSVTTTNPFAMAAMQRPAWTVGLRAYRAVWIACGLACLGAVAGQLLYLAGWPTRRSRTECELLALGECREARGQCQLTE